MSFRRPWLELDIIPFFAKPKICIRMPGLADDTIGRKTKAKHYLDHPDAPGREDARLYYCHDAFGVQHDHERDQFQKIDGQAHNIDASDAVEIATKMAGAKMMGHSVALTPPSQNYTIREKPVW